MAAAGGILTGSSLEELPSRQMYEKLKGQDNGDCSEEWSEARKVKVSLGSGTIPEAAHSGIMSTLCYIKGLNGSISDNRVPEEYKFFYYHVGDILLKTSEDDKFEDSMIAMYSIIAQYAKELENYLKYTHKSKDEFRVAKILFDYKKDENKISEQLRGQLNGRNKKCNDKYYAHLQAINEAYSKSCDKCKNSEQGKWTDWCPEFKKLFTDYETVSNLNLNCKKLGDVEEGDTLEDEHLNVVKARLKLYEEFDTGSDDCGNGSILQTIKDTISKHTDVDHGAEAVVGSWCSAYNKRTEWDTLPNDEYCHFLYYSIGHTLLEKNKHIRDVVDIMKELFPHLKGWKSITGCGNFDTSLDETEFNRRKGIFEKFQQLKIMKEQLRKSKGVPSLSSSALQGAKCTKSYDDHLKDVITFLKNEHTKCTTGDERTQPYCKNFLQMCPQCNPSQLSILTCEVDPKTQTSTNDQSQNQQQGTYTGTDNTSTNIAAGVPGALGAIGLPAIGFLLYKVITYTYIYIHIYIYIYTYAYIHIRTYI
ncbi:KIR protein [Plasmodium knowlesi strain H]|uniref:KIR protein n=3 Tax=Plasmodium knowlesi TaxID=5850 RepID=A0A1A7VYU0_PLAKH|nr:KIR protein [Plasmodium knowlesi strain H]OTN68019.1 KIR protein [Plasmodium knowlesi]CAA9990237.1 KIR protein [Plasmodium knowlesi strain H]SBO26821.1 KIR protein [Plasmodium knowlesi strain H]SBO28440.1 KIR protein [Plasmodium knowlesi strain H]VVS79711.1 KIR protein [Plasmodium knowlesi strain H]